MPISSPSETGLAYSTVYEYSSDERRSDHEVRVPPVVSPEGRQRSRLAAPSLVLVVSAGTLERCLALADALDSPCRPGAADGVASLQMVWHGRFGSMLIEVRNGRAYVDGDLVEATEVLDVDVPGSLRRGLDAR